MDRHHSVNKSGAVGDEVTVTVPHLRTPRVDFTFLIILTKQNQEALNHFTDSHDTPSSKLDL